MISARRDSCGLTTQRPGDQRKPAEPERTRRWAQRLPGVLLAVAVAAVSVPLATVVPLASAAVVAIVLGMVIGNSVRVPAACEPGLAYAGKTGLQAAIVLLGAGLGLAQIATTGRESIAVLVGSLVIGVAAILLLGRLIGVSLELRSLIAVGTGVCGASAIAALAPVIKARRESVALAVATVFLMNVVAVLIFPPIGALLGMSEEAFGIWAGTAINDTSSVVAAGYAYGEVAGETATVVKLARATMIVPLVVLFGVAARRAETAAGTGGSTAVPWYQLVPIFLYLFLAAALLNTLGLVEMLRLESLPDLGQFLIAVALGAIGLTTRLRDLLRTGPRPLLLGLAGWFVLIVVSLGLLAATGWLD